MLKKAGIVVAGSAAALLALSPLAFAGDYDWGHHHHRGGHSQVKKNSVNYNNSNSSANSGLVALGNVNALNNLNVCPSVAAGVGLGNLLGVLSPTNNGDTESGSPVCAIDQGVRQDADS